MRVGGFYDRYWEQAGFPVGHGFAIGQRKAKLKKALAELAEDAPVLDAGCGNGEFSHFLTNVGYRVIGIDVSSIAAAKAKTIFPPGRFVVASIEAGLPFKEGGFSAVWCTEVLEHVLDVHAGLAELNRVVVQGGLLVLTVPYHGLAKNLLIALVAFERHYNPYISHIRFYTRKSLCDCLERAGFTAISWGGVGRCWPLWMSHFVIARKTGVPGHTPQIIG